MLTRVCIAGFCQVLCAARFARYRALSVRCEGGGSGARSNKGLWCGKLRSYQKFHVSGVLACVRSQPCRTQFAQSQPCRTWRGPGPVPLAPVPGCHSRGRNPTAVPRAIGHKRRTKKTLPVKRFAALDGYTPEKMARHKQENMRSSGAFSAELWRPLGNYPSYFFVPWPFFFCGVQKWSKKH